MQWASVEPVGFSYELYNLEKIHKVGFTRSRTKDEVKFITQEESNGADELEEEYITFLETLDPNDWKNQDHYAVLGLKHLRYLASEDQIKKMYRLKVLKYHPDKQISMETSQINNYFSCINKAYEILGNATKRMSYDSVDPFFNNDVPACNLHSKMHFFEVFAPVFERNARWSVVSSAPLLGDENSDRNAVEEFYAFWYAFQSWREFSYLDEEEKEKGQHREERRWIEKKNRAARVRLKKEEMSRIRKLVDNAYACDPRIQMFKLQDKEEKEMQKKEKMANIQKKEAQEQEKKQQALEAEEHAKQAALMAEKLLQEKQKKERNAVRNSMKKERKNLRLLLESAGYFASDEVEKVQHMVDVERLVKTYELERLKELIARLRSTENHEEQREIFMREMTSFRQQEHSQDDSLDAPLRVADTGVQSNGVSAAQARPVDPLLLSKAFNLFPAGTVSRWETITEFINEHSSERYSVKEILTQAQQLKEIRHTRMNRQNENGKDDPSMHKKPWTLEEQRLLEHALKRFPPSVPARWVRIAECLPHRSVNECIQRYKDLVEIVRQKREAAAAAAASKCSPDRA